MGMEAKTIINICLGSSCYHRGNEDVLETIKMYLKEHQLDNKVEFKGHLCDGHCSKGPNIQINDELYSGIDNKSILEILDHYFNRSK